MARAEQLNCPECGVQFNTREALEQHEKQEHKMQTRQTGQGEPREDQSRRSENREKQQ